MLKFFTRICLMQSFMLENQVLVPKGYAERSCVLVSYRLPFLRHCFILCHKPINGDASLQIQAQTELMSFFLAQAYELAHTTVGDSQAFMLIHSGASIRKRSNWHLHVFVVQHRWQKAWVYTILGIKNMALTLVAPVIRCLAGT